MIDPAVIAAMEKLRHQVIESGGKPEVWAANAATRERFFGDATELLGLPVIEIASIPDMQVLVCSKADVEYFRENPPTPEDANNVN